MVIFGHDASQQQRRGKSRIELPTSILLRAVHHACRWCGGCMAGRGATDQHIAACEDSRAAEAIVARVLGWEQSA